MNIFLVIGLVFVIIGIIIAIQSRGGTDVTQKSQGTVAEETVDYGEIKEHRELTEEQQLLITELQGLTPTEVYVKYKTHTESTKGFDEYAAVAALYTTNGRGSVFMKDIDEMSEKEATFTKKYLFPFVRKLFPKVDSISVLDESIVDDYATLQLKQKNMLGSTNGIVTLQKEHGVWKIIDEHWENKKAANDEF